MRNKLSQGLWVICLLFTPALWAQDEPATEASAADAPAVESQLMVQVGESMELTAGDDKFPAIYVEDQTGRVLGGMVLLHDRGGNPNWPGVIRPLRQQLPEYGWATLSIDINPVQVPTETAAAEHMPPLLELDKLGPRISAAIAYLKEKEIEKIVVLGFGTGAAQMAEYYANNDEPEEVKGLIMVNAMFSDPKASVDVLQKLAEKSAPVLDVCGTAVYKDVLAASERRELLGRHHKDMKYKHYAILGAPQEMSYYEDILIKRVRVWLRRTVIQGVAVDSDKVDEAI